MHRTVSHMKYRLMYHLVWIPKYRKRALKDKLTERLRELFHQCAEINDWKIEELNIQIDHVHMLVELKTTIFKKYRPLGRLKFTFHPGKFERKYVRQRVAALQLANN
jgi:putative transposase